MRTIISVIAVAINLLVFVTVFAFMMKQSENRRTNSISTLFFMLMEIGIALDTVLILTAR